MECIPLNLVVTFEALELPDSSFNFIPMKIVLSLMDLPEIMRALDVSFLRSWLTEFLNHLMTNCHVLKNVDLPNPVHSFPETFFAEIEDALTT